MSFGQTNGSYNYCFIIVKFKCRNAERSTVLTYLNYLLLEFLKVSQFSSAGGVCSVVMEMDLLTYELFMITLL